MINSILGVIVLVLLVRLATKASAGSILGAGVLLFILLVCSYLLLRVSEDRGEPHGASRGFVGRGHVPPLPDASALRLTKSRIDLGEERSVGEEGGEQDQDRAESTPAKPDWVNHPPKRVGNVTRRVVASDPFSTVEECHAQLEGLLQGAVHERLQDLIGEGPEFLSPQIGLGYIVQEICQDEFTETVSASFGEMRRMHVLMEFNPAVDAYLLAAQEKTERRHRLGVVGQFAAAVVGLLLLVYGLLKFDTWTHGYYTKRLLVGVPGVIIAVAVLFWS
ncbi:MAG: hypothetical protein GXP28_01710 [Planctomycetes bacterium]|nr:hypothetical protein [Planctomycetota bacterium]